MRLAASLSAIAQVGGELSRSGRPFNRSCSQSASRPWSCLKVRPNSSPSAHFTIACSMS